MINKKPIFKKTIIIIGLILFFLFLYMKIIKEKQIFSPIPLKKGVKVIPLNN